VPAEESFPGPDIAVGIGDTHHIRLYRVLQKGVETGEIPRARLFIHQGAEEVSSVERGRKDDVFPEL
jgi:hypothetical protein